MKSPINTNQIYFFNTLKFLTMKNIIALNGITPKKKTNNMKVMPWSFADKSSFSWITKRNPYITMKVIAHTTLASLFASLSNFSIRQNYTTIGQEGGEIIYGII